MTAEREPSFARWLPSPPPIEDKRMDSIDNFRERFEAPERRTQMVEQGMTGAVKAGVTAVGSPVPDGTTQSHHLASYLAQWPLSPPWFWRRRWVWVSLGLLLWMAETFLPAEVDMLPLSLVSVLLASWSGNLPWSVGLACLLPWGSLLSWWWWGGPWPLWVEVVNGVGDTIAMVVAAVLMTAVQRHAVRLALERDPRLPRQQASRELSPPSPFSR